MDQGSITMTERSETPRRTRRQPEANRRRARHRRRWFRIASILTGGGALLWVLLRVAPRPNRASYPCQQVAVPLAGGFLVWLVHVTGAVFLWRRGRCYLGQSRYPIALGCLLVAVVLGGAALLRSGEKPALALPQEPNDPIGTAIGVFPGRVCWAHEPDATDWDGPGDGHWWEPAHTDQTLVAGMFSGTLRGLTEQASDAAAWDALFRHFNQTHGNGDVGYTPGEKIALKVNFVGFHWLWGGVDPDSYDIESRRDYMNTSPQVILAVLRQLVENVGVAEADISVGDPNGLFPNEYYDYCHDVYPDVQYHDHNGGNDDNPRRQYQFSSVPLYWSSHPVGVTQDYVPQSFVEAAYLINIANFKSHHRAGVTLCAKNHFGSLIRWPQQSSYYDMHASLALNNPTPGSYRDLVDLLGHAHLGGKTLLSIVDGLYAGVHPVDDAPRRWDFPPFNGDWTSSLFVSPDPVALESVCFDFIQEEGDSHQYPQIAGADDYLHEAALAHDPSSETYYDPDHEGDVLRLGSLGAHEHWNNSTDRQYSRNLGTGDGIELVAVAAVTAVPETENEGSGDNEFGADGNYVAARETDLELAAFPNPFNPATTIRFVMPTAMPTRVAIFAVDGRHIASLVDEVRSAGRNTVTWNGTDGHGRQVAAGIYMCRIRAGSLQATGRLVLLK